MIRRRIGTFQLHRKENPARRLDRCSESGHVMAVMRRCCRRQHKRTDAACISPSRTLRSSDPKETTLDPDAVAHTHTHVVILLLITIFFLMNAPHLRWRFTSEQDIWEQRVRFQRPIEGDHAHQEGPQANQDVQVPANDTLTCD